MHRIHPCSQFPICHLVLQHSTWCATLVCSQDSCTIWKRRHDALPIAWYCMILHMWIYFKVVAGGQAVAAFRIILIMFRRSSSRRSTPFNLRFPIDSQPVRTCMCPACVMSQGSDSSSQVVTHRVRNSANQIWSPLFIRFSCSFQS